MEIPRDFLDVEAVVVVSTGWLGRLWKICDFGGYARGDRGWAAGVVDDIFD